MKRSWSIAVLAASMALLGCRNPVVSERQAALGPEEPGVPHGPLHRPGQPCTLCHSASGGNNPEFSLAGTVYKSAASNEPLVGAVVHVIDNDGEQRDFTTNAAGTFYVTTSDWAPAFPLWTSVDYTCAARTLVHVDMQTQIFRATACADCHFDPRGPSSAGHIYFELYGSGGVPVTGSVRSGACALLALSFIGCAGPSDPPEQLVVPSSARFELVSGVLGTGCGSLDCHGQVGRSLRIYSQAGLRLDPEAFPTLDGGTVSSAEVEDNYQAVITLEPEVLALVLREHGASPERLTLVRKGRGSEAHKGGAAIAVGSDSDDCILSWLASALDETACIRGAAIPQRPTAPQ